MAGLKLTTCSTSPSTVCYTVSNGSTSRSRLGRGFRIIVSAVRISTAIVCSAIFILQSRRILSSVNLPIGIGIRAFENTWAHILSYNVGAEFTTDGRFWWMIPTTCMLLVWLAVRRDHIESNLAHGVKIKPSAYISITIEESLLSIRGLGIQTSSLSTTYLSTPTTRFIPKSQIQDIFIHEAFIGFEVRFYLAVVVDGEEQAVVVFPKLLPRRELLEEVWRGARAGLTWSKNSV